MKYKIFISYRIESGAYQADALEGKLKLKLKEDCNIFMDRTGIKGGNWKEKLDENIRGYSNFIVIISKGCFPYTKEGKDYFLYEIDQSLRQGKNVIPVYYDRMSYEDIKDYLSGVEDFDNQNHIIFDKINTEGSINKIIEFLKTEKEVLNKRYKLLSTERATVRQDLILLEEDKTMSKCPVCANSYTEEMTYCHICGYKFFDELEKSVANSNEKLQERARLKIHKELWRNCQSNSLQDNAELNQELDATIAQMQLSEIEEANAKERTFVVGKTSFKMILVKGDTFMMGAPNSDIEAYNNEKPQHIVKLDDYYISETVVTQGLWKAVMGSNPSYWKGDELPVEKVSWNDTQEFLKKLSIISNINFRLPTEAEWEFAARSGKRDNVDNYSGGDSIDEVAWYNANSGYQTQPVMSKKANGLGLYDMSGNVWEWCEDLYDEKYYSNSISFNPICQNNSNNHHVLRGGCWNSFGRICRVMNRSSCGADRCDNTLGFRIALDSFPKGLLR